MFESIWLPFAISCLIACCWLFAVLFIAKRQWINSNLTRKIIHIGTGPIFVLCWLLFPDQPAFRFVAAVIPLTITIVFLLVGTNVIHGESFVKAMARTGDRREILRGPLYYGIIFIIVTIFFWKTTLPGIVALMVLCGGDGMADIIGTKIMGYKLPWSKKKTLAGSLGMLIFGWLFSVTIAYIYIQAGYFSNRIEVYLFPFLIIALAGTLLETLPVDDLDNIIVSAGTLIVGMLLKI